MGGKYVIGIDLGGTKINCALSDFKGDIISQSIISTKAYKGEEGVVNRIIGCIDNIIFDAKVDIYDIVSIGIGSPGPLDYKKGVIITTPNLPFKNFNIVQPISNKYNIPTYLDNDANVAALGEYVFGAGKNTNNMVYVTVSTGIGGGAIINGNVYRGNTSNALEVGHMTINPNGPKCNCGNYGCAEALASGTAISKNAKKIVEQGKKTTLVKYDKITSYEVFKEAKKGDYESLKIVNESLNYLGICIANIVSCFDPELILIGGGVSKAGDIVFDKVREVVNKRCFKTLSKSCRIDKAGLETDAGVKGAIALALIEKGIEI
ncbi:ROK family protein [Clostridium rectalis]|uniref:ROK family protein n=1 Tax=Clostridium rectalis TaxID=2040295 RepID=UPI000F62EE67|nr:ROK family protein [Clostridium rectalis]